MKTLLLALASLTLLAGCAGNDDVNEAKVASLEYEGNESGTHEDSVDCDKDARLAGTGNVDDGTLEVTVTDGSGAMQFEKTYNAGVEADGERMSGASGQWTLTVTRAGDDLVGDGFNGQYTFTLTC